MKKEINMHNKVLILFTMDVELPTTSGEVSGPKSHEEGEISVCNYMKAIGEYGYSPTFFIHPELGEVQGSLFQKLKANGACLGLHLHSTKFFKKRYPCEMGGLSENEQREILRMAIDLFQENLGFRPEIFRPGVFSANDNTFKVLHDLGFKGGSVSIPGRIWPERCCIWSGSISHPHFANANLRHLKGNLPFVEIPLSVDYTQGLQLNHQAYWHYRDLRPGQKDIEAGSFEKSFIPLDDYKLILKNIVNQLVSDDPSVKTIVVDTHNDLEYLDMSNESARQLHTVLEYIKPELKKYGLEPVDATLDSAIQEFFEAEAGVEVVSH